MPFTDTTAHTLRAYRQDGTEVLPGETITMCGTDYTFRSAIRPSNAAGTDGLIETDHYGQLYAAPFELTVRRAEAGSPADRNASPSEAARKPVAADLAAVLADITTVDADPLADYSQQLAVYRALPGAIRSYLAAGKAHAGMAADDDAEHARTSAPPRPGSTRNIGYTVYAVIETGRHAWLVAAKDASENHVTWLAETTHPDGTGPLFYSYGNYHTRGETAAEEALADLANRAGQLDALTALATGMATRETWQESRSEAMAILTERHDVGRAKAREGIDEATALGSARVTWHSHGQRRSYTIIFNRYRCTYAIRS